MKKVFALVLAVAMVMSMSAVSFAKGEELHQGVIAVDGNAYQYNADYNRMRNTIIQYGKPAYFALFANQDPKEVGNSGDLALVSNAELVDGMKVKVEFEMGKELVADNGISIVKKKVDVIDRAPGSDLENAFNFSGSGYYYFVEIKTVAKETTSDADIVATMTLNKSKKGDESYTEGGVKKDYNYKVKDLEVDIAVNVAYDNMYLDSGRNATQLFVKGDSVEELEPETYYLLKYESDEDAEITFGLEPNEGTFTVDVSGQGKNLIYFDTLVNEGIVAANPADAKIFALNFNNVKFNRTGEFVYEGEDFEYAYEVMADGSLKLLGEFDGEEVTFKTRVLGKYLFSDVELVAAPAAVTTPDAPVQVTPVENPTTGAAC